MAKDEHFAYRTRGGGARRKMSDEDVREALSMYEGGVPVKEICEWYGVAVSTLYMYLRPHLELYED